MPKSLSKQSKEFVVSLISFFERERDEGGPFIPLEAVRERVATALNISITTVSRISAASKNFEILQSPSKTKQKSKPIVDIDDATQCAIRNVIFEMYSNKVHITKSSLLEILKQRDTYNGGLTSLGKILKAIGFKWLKDNPRRGLMELQHIALARIDFLQTYMKNIKNNYFWQFVYLDETWIFQNGTVGRSWQDNSLQSVKRIKSEGKRYIVLHAGNENGFIPGASLIFSSKTKDGDYHGEMNHKTFLKTQLLELVKKNKPEKLYTTELLAHKYGHMVLRLPPYHCIFNPIENIWGITKNYYNRHIGRNGGGVEECLKMWDEALSKVDKTMWQNTIRHTEETIKEWWHREIGFDNLEITPLIITDDTSEDESDNLEMEN